MRNQVTYLSAVGGRFALVALVWMALSATGCGTPGRAAAEPEEHEAAAEPAGHSHEEDVVQLSTEQIAAWGIRTSQAAPARIAGKVELPGEVRLNPDRRAQVIPALPGVAAKILKTIGSPVARGELLAVLQSRELSEQRADRLVALKRLELAEKALAREETLWKENISSERDYLEAKRECEEARILLLAAEQKLATLGGPTSDGADSSRLNEYCLYSPLDGTVIEKNLTLGEVVSGETPVFGIADLSTVWVVCSVYQRDLPLVRSGQSATVSAGDGQPGCTARIDWVSPTLDEQTRTAAARLVLDNADGRWRPGLFVSVRVTADTVELPLAVDAAALVGVEDHAGLFVQEEHGFEFRPVRTGRRGEGRVEILEGLSAGESYVSAGAFTLKSELDKESFAHAGHSH